MLAEKPMILNAIQQIMLQNKFERHRAPVTHAGGKIIWFYPSLLGQRGALEIDINFMYRQPLFPVLLKSPNIEEYKNLYGPVLDINELAAGKLSALFDRSVSRDWFDVHHILTQAQVDKKKLKIAFITYLAMSKIELSTLSAERINFDLSDLRNRLIPLLHQFSVVRKTHELKDWAATRIDELRQKLSVILPLEEHEIQFIKKVRNEGIISPELITNDKEISQRIVNHPAINWVIKQKSVS